FDLDHLGAELAEDGGAMGPGNEGAEVEDADAVQCAHDRSPMLAARSSNFRASLICTRSIISPFLSFTAPRPSRSAASIAASTSSAQATASADGVITSWMISICEGWIAILHSKPSAAARLAAARKPSLSRIGEKGPSMGVRPKARQALAMRAVAKCQRSFQ